MNCIPLTSQEFDNVSEIDLKAGLNTCTLLQPTLSTSTINIVMESFQKLESESGQTRPIEFYQPNSL